MNRRNALRTLLATLVAAPGALALSAYAQARVQRVVLISGASESSQAENVKLLREGLKDLGYAEGRNLALELRFGGTSRERTDQLAAEAVASKPDVILTQGYGSPAVAKLTKTIPIISIYSGDMVDGGLIKSMAHPGGNISGIQLMALELVGKRIEILKECVPGIKHLAVLASPTHAGVHRERDVSIAAAKQLGLGVAYYPVNNPQELDAGLSAAQAAGADALVVFPDNVTFGGAERIAAFALKHRLPMVSGWDHYALAGGLVSYGPNLRASWRHAASYVVKVLKGADPGSLPVEFPMTFELVVNLKTARALKVKIPQSVLLRADKVIE